MKLSLDQASIEVYWITPEGRFVYTNKTTQDRLGYPGGRLKDMHVWDVDPTHGKDIREERWNKLKEQGSLNFESFHLTKNGEIYPVEITSHYISFEGEEYEFAFAKDITERKKREESLRESKTRFRKFFRDIEDAVFVLSIETEDYADILEANPAAEKHTGYTREELIGMNMIDDIVMETISMDQEEIEKKIREGETVRLVEKQKKKDGTEIWAEPIITPILYQGKRATLSVNRDITEKRKREGELKEREERYRGLFEASLDGIFIIDAETGEIEDTNPSVKKILGYSKEDLQEKKVWEIDCFDQIAKNKEKFEELAENEHLKNKDLRMKTKKGEKVPVEFSFSSYSAGEKMVVQCNIRDIYERKKAEEREEFLNTLLKQDLRSKCQTIQGYLHLMQETDSSKKQEEYLEKSIKSGIEAREILELAEELDRIEKREWIVEKDLQKMVDDSIKDLECLTERLEIEIKNSVPDGIGRVLGHYSLKILLKQIIKTRADTATCKKMHITGEREETRAIIRLEDDGDKLYDEIKDLFSGSSYQGVTTGIGGIRYYIISSIADHNNAEISAGDSQMGGARLEIKLKRPES
ncbi:MAG: PAS domain S-box protein [Candidatus Hadarchaeota archaeon]